MEDRFKFRLFDKKTGEMIYKFTIDSEGSFADVYGDKKLFVLQQCTGLKDKNGKLIYEGDILKLSDNDNPNMNNIIGVVKYSKEYAMFFINIPNNIAWYEFCEVEKKGLIIIGNIYENKELLEAQG